MNSKFYDSVRTLFGKPLSSTQMEGLEAILAAGFGLPLKQLAYVLATAWHETAKTMQPVREWGKGINKKYGITDPETGQKYYGRGHVQLTWRYNYEKAGAALGLDMVNKPDLMLIMGNSVRVMIEGMKHGWFTSKKLSNYINDQVTDYVNARKIINGLDKAQLIAEYAIKFEKALTDSAWQ